MTAQMELQSVCHPFYPVNPSCTIQLESELGRMPSSAAHSMKGLQRKQELNGRIEELRKEINNIKFKLRQLNVR